MGGDALGGLHAGGDRRDRLCQGVGVPLEFRRDRVRPLLAARLRRGGARGPAPGARSTTTAAARPGCSFSGGTLMMRLLQLSALALLLALGQAAAQGAGDAVYVVTH